MTLPVPHIQIPVDLTNPGQFFACCGLLELASRVDEHAEGWFDDAQFQLQFHSPFGSLLDELRKAVVANAMSAIQTARFEELSSMSAKTREKAGLDDEWKAFDALRREMPVVLQSLFELKIDWFGDERAGGSRFKTWAGRQSVLDIASAMHAGLHRVDASDPATLWNSVRGGGLPFNFDSDLGGQGSALDIGFSFDPLATSEMTRIAGTCRPALEILAFIGLQRFRPREISKQNRFVYAAWRQSLSVSVAAAAASQAILIGNPRCYEFRLLYRTKYLKSFLPAFPFQGVNDE